MYDLKTDPNPSSMVFANDLIIYVSWTDPSLIQNKLKEWVVNVNNSYITWNLSLKPLNVKLYYLE